MVQNILLLPLWIYCSVCLSLLFFIAFIAALLCWYGKQAIKNKRDRQTEHYILGESHNIMKRRKLLPHLMSGITFHSFFLLFLFYFNLFIYLFLFCSLFFLPFFIFFRLFSFFLSHLISFLFISFFPISYFRITFDLFSFFLIWFLFCLFLSYFLLLDYFWSFFFLVKILFTVIYSQISPSKVGFLWGLILHERFIFIQS